MRDGRYAIRLSLAGTENGGSLHLDENRLTGDAGPCSVRGTLARRRDRFVARLEVEIEAEHASLRCIPRKFAMDAEGVLDEKAFAFLGTGPMGVIVELVGRYEPLD